MQLRKGVKFRRFKGPYAWKGLPWGNRVWSFRPESHGARKITARQIEAARIAMTRHVKRGGRIWTRIFPDKPITKKPAEVRMGKEAETLNVGLPR